MILARSDGVLGERASNSFGVHRVLERQSSPQSREAKGVCVSRGGGIIYPDSPDSALSYLVHRDSAHKYLVR